MDKPVNEGISSRHVVADEDVAAHGAVSGRFQPPLEDTEDVAAHAIKGKVEASEEDVEGHGAWNRGPVHEPAGSQRIQDQPPASDDDDVEGHAIKPRV